MIKLARRKGTCHSRYVLPAAVMILLPAAGPAGAQSSPDTPAELQPGPATIVTPQTENDVVGRTDRNYTAALPYAGASHGLESWISASPSPVPASG